MTKRAMRGRKAKGERLEGVSMAFPLWQLEISELTGHNLEARGRDEVNRLLQEGWVLLHIYTLKYQEDGVWRERPMAILGLPSSRGTVGRVAHQVGP
jgi:hypothetical protein